MVKRTASLGLVGWLVRVKKIKRKTILIFKFFFKYDKTHRRGNWMILAWLETEFFFPKLYWNIIFSTGVQPG